MLDEVSFSESTLWISSNHETNNNKRSYFFYPIIIFLTLLLLAIYYATRKRLLRRGKHYAQPLLYSTFGILVLIYVHVSLLSRGSFDSIKQCEQQQIKSLLQDMTTNTCKPTFPCVVFYNRLPKAGSTSVLSWMRSRIEEESTRMIHSTILKYRYLSHSDQISFVDTFWRSLFDRGMHTIFDRHMFYLNTSRISSSTPRPVYINMVRNPIDRCVSRYRYERSTRLRIPDVSLDECVLQDGSCHEIFSTTTQHTVRPIWYDGSTEDAFEILREECNNYMTRWFCGMSPDCEYPPTFKTLEIAKKHVKNEYLYVGIMEDMKHSLRMLQYLLPDFFGFDHAWDVPDENFSSEQTDISASTLKLIEDANSLDLALYEYIKSLHNSRLRRCVSYLH